MKKFLLTLVLLVGMVFGLFAQKLTYQAVVRNNNQQLVVNTDVKATVTITFSTGNPYSEEVNATTNIHGLLSIEFGGDALNGRNWEGATIAVKVVNSTTPSIVYVNDEPRPVSAVPYALSVNGQSIQNYLTEHNYVDLDKLKDTLNAYPTTAVMDGRHYLRSDSAVITTMQNNIVNLTLHTTRDAIRDSVAGQIHDSIAAIGATSPTQNHSHSNMDILSATTASFTTANKTTLDSLVAVGAQKNVQSDWNQETTTADDYIKNKPTSVGAFTNDAGYLTSDSAVITTMQNNIVNLTLHSTRDAIRDSVAGQIHDSISNIAAKAHTHDNKALLDTYTQTEDNLADAVAKKHEHDNADILNNTTAPYTKADSIKLKGIADSAEVNVQSDWNQTDNAKDDYIKNKPSITDTVNNILTTGKYVTETTLDARHYLRSDSTVITTIQGNITSLQSGLSAAIGKEKTDSTTLAGRIDALEGAAMDCNKVKECIKDTLSNYSTTAALNDLLQQLTARLDAQDTKMDSLAHVVDSLAKRIPGGGDTPTEVADGQPCPGAAKVSDGSNIYNTVKIGNQCWMKENLRTSDGDGVYPKNNGQELSEDEKVTYGRLYTWTAMMNGAPSTNYPGGTTDADTIVHGICPAGWHVPSGAEWDTLTTYVNTAANGYRCNGDRTIANALSSSTGWQSPHNCGAGYNSTTLNATGFSAVPAGYYFDGSSGGFGDYAYFWYATRDADGFAWCWNLSSTQSGLLRGSGKTVRYSVRCLRDAGVGGPAGGNEIAGTTPSAPATMSCEQVMECMGDTLGKLNTKIEAQGAEIETLNGTVTTQGAEIETLNNTVQSQGEKIDSLANLVDSLSNLTPGGGDDPATFTCGTDKVKDVDNNEYNTVKIGNQCWMKENLRTNVDGSVYPKKDYQPVTGEDTVTYGRLYTWTAMMKGAPSTNYPGETTEADTIVHGICPAGWHVPSDAEWDTLTTYVNTEANGYRCNGYGTIANALSSSTGWRDPRECAAGYNSTTRNLTGFSAVPAGNCKSASFFSFGYHAYFWSATQNDDNNAWYRYLGSINSDVKSSNDVKYYGNSVRCLRDAGIGGAFGSNETAGTTPSTPATMSCEQVMECMGDTLGKLNTKIENLKNTVDSLAALIPGGDTVKFTCGTSKVKDFDNNEYNTVKIGSQCWMKENLRTTKYADGAGIGDEEMFNPGDNEAYVATYGKLYTWSAATRDSSTTYPAYGQAKVQGICPAGWHVPSYVEWDTLTDYVKSKDEYQCDHNPENIAKALASKTGWNDSEESTCAVGNDQSSNNATGFNAVPAGDHDDNYVIGSYAGFWLATKYVANTAFYCGLLYSGATVDRQNYSTDNGFSVRCLKD